MRTSAGENADEPRTSFTRLVDSIPLALVTFFILIFFLIHTGGNIRALTFRT